MGRTAVNRVREKKKGGAFQLAGSVGAGGDAALCIGFIWGEYWERRAQHKRKLKLNGLSSRHFRFFPLGIFPFPLNFGRFGGLEQPHGQRFGRSGELDSALYIYISMYIYI